MQAFNGHGGRAPPALRPGAAGPERPRRPSRACCSATPRKSSPWRRRSSRSRPAPSPPRRPSRSSVPSSTPTTRSSMTTACAASPRPRPPSRRLRVVSIAWMRERGYLFDRDGFLQPRADLRKDGYFKLRTVPGEYHRMKGQTKVTRPGPHLAAPPVARRPGKVLRAAGRRRREAGRAPRHLSHPSNP